MLVSCTKCKKEKDVLDFMNERSKQLKMCIVCREKGKESKNRNKCKHDKRRNLCKECGGTSICEHGRERRRCKNCNGTSICEHGRRRRWCKDCNGSGICEHDKRRCECIICNPSCACAICKSVYISKRSPYYPHCLRCFCYLNPDADIPRKIQLKEHHLRDALRELFPLLSARMIFDKKVSGGCSQKRPDVLLDLLTHTIIVECDENQHRGYSCEQKRSMSIFQDLGSRPMVLIRLNPDSYMKNGKRVKGCFRDNKSGGYNINKKEWNKRLEALVLCIRKYVDIESIKKEFTEEKLFYNE